MDVSAALAAAPWLRKAWKWTPAPLRFPLLAIAAIILLRRWWTRRNADELTVAEHTAAPDATTATQAHRVAAISPVPEA